MIIGAIAPGPMTSSARPLAVAAVIAWVLTAAIGLYMLRTWIARGGLRRQRATGVGVPPAVVFSHAGAALTGLLVWIGFVKTEWDPLGWLGVGLVTTAIGLGVCTVTLWTPYPVVVPEGGPGGQGGLGGRAVPPQGGPGGWVPPDHTVTDEMIAGLLADPFPERQRPRIKLAPFVPVAHGFAALATFMLAVLAAISAILGIF
jgi:manganese efflux pump family protein